ncbi:hypothetical protein ACROYT_G034015 [Oculina patagonica]
MQTLLGFLMLTTLTAVIYGKQLCNHHAHCQEEQYCDTSLGVCKEGVRKCHSHWDCGSRNLGCKEGICQKSECTRHTECPGNQACKYPPGICEDYEPYCRYDSYCKNGYICVDKRCKKRECNGDHNCKLGDKCVNGFCKPIPGFCSNDKDCDKDQCCAKAGHNPHGLCKNMSKPGDDWCPLKQSIMACPCVSGYVCQMTTSSYYWGKCIATDGGSGSGSGLDDF